MDAEQSKVLETRCCIVGGGPAGMMAGWLLARAGIDVVVLEKHADFFRDFRGDTVHPSTLELMYELGVLDEFLKVPHQQMKEMSVHFDKSIYTIADFSHLPTQCKFMALMPQWDFLNFVRKQASQYSNFHLMMESKVVDLIEDNRRIVGVKAETSHGLLSVRADLIIGADGRTSLVRDKANLPVTDLGAPMDVLWMRLSRRPEDGLQTLGNFTAGKGLIALNRDTYWQLGFVFPKNSIEEIKRRGLEALQADIVTFLPFTYDRINELKSWDDIKLLSVQVNRLEQWHRPGLLCIGDAAHAMSPIGGVGINLAIQDAVAAANVLAKPLLEGDTTCSDLDKIQCRRTLPTKLTQGLQLFIQDHLIFHFLHAKQSISAPWFVKLVEGLPILRRIPAYVIGVGFRSEHIKSDNYSK